MTDPLPIDSQKLSALIAEAKAGQNAKSDILNKYKDVLMKERGAGTSVRIMVGALTRLGVSVSEETLRLWFVRQESEGTVSAPKPPKTRQPSKVTAGTPPAPAASSTRARVARADI